ncbi:ABC transporter ATP-binding protein [[Mycoplasma] phocae]|uniref:ABC transporter ATP-binding protein n=1 Tax=[Mycoplasma] phocae TaxID=142651 RepID=A0A2Z5IQJ9_9BACT|nr:ABC transporter ATP-binding protein [[Mycoplasma] phocae]AXE60980.1 ABC transporter ATP-binding protein [[Mycoplasma] phocae]
MINKKVIFQAKNIYKSVKGHFLIDNANFSILENRIHILVGENGAGKSTLMKICTGGDLDFEGTLFFDGQNLDSIEKPKSFLFFNTHIKFPYYLSAINYIREYCRLFTGRKINKNLVIKKFKEYGLELKMKNNPNTFSSGEKKKLILLFSEIAKPQLLFLDEPDSNLDPTARKMLYLKLREFTKAGITIFISSHLIDEIRHYVDDATFIKRGKIIWTGPIVNRDDLTYIYNQHLLYDKEYK